jgi:antitoxin component of RelBE/YafQ-DinJ toxin-antitoxin module
MKYNSTITFKIDKEQKEKFEKLCKINGISPSQIMRMFIAKKINGDISHFVKTYV